MWRSRSSTAPTITRIVFEEVVAVDLDARSLAVGAVGQRSQIVAVLTGFKNRLSVLFNWTIAFLGRGPSERVITAQQVFARHALEAQAAVAGSGAAREGSTAA